MASEPPPAATDATAEMAKVRPGLHRRLYEWVMGWADNPHGTTALAGIAFAESSFFPIPPDVLLIALGVGRPARAYFYALVCTLGSVVGGVAGYAIGWLVWEEAQGFFFHYVPGFTHAVFDRVRGYYDAYGFLAVLIAGFTPIPFKVFTIASGVFSMNLVAFVGAAAISRGLRFFIEGALITRFGARVREILDRNLNVLSVAFVVLLVGGFLVLRLIR